MESYHDGDDDDDHNDGYPDDGFPDDDGDSDDNGGLIIIIFSNCAHSVFPNKTLALQVEMMKMLVLLMRTIMSN